MEEDVKERFHAVEESIKRADDEVVRVRGRLHALETEIPTVKLNMTEVVLETKQQTPLLKQVHSAVLGPEGLGEKVRNHDRYLHMQTRILLAVLLPLLGTIALATCYAAFSKPSKMTPEVAQQIVDKLREATKS